MIESQTPTAVVDSAASPMSAGGRLFSRWLTDQLKARKLTQRQLAQKSGVHHSTICRLVRGDRTPSFRTADLLAHGLGMAIGPEGLHRNGPGSTEPPMARVERALRLDDHLGEAQVRRIMNVYLAVRWRHRS